MHYCFVCGEIGEGAFRFPQNGEKLSLWLKALGLSEKLPKQARICPGHFHPSEILVTKGGKRFIKEGSIPAKHIRREIPSLEHNYASNSRNEEEILFPWQLFLLVVFRLCLLLDYFLNAPYETSSSSPRKHTSKVNVKLGEKGKILLNI